ncbi:MAG: HAMP domain-containing histidine kinase [Ruminococcaceae bacterium]|nr:HAMP domain-containing histidine kinase [Oscillospiraceae bacterium]
MKSAKAKKPLSIKWKIFFFLALFSGIILLILWTVQSVFLGDIYRSIKMSDLNECAEVITDSLGTNKLEQRADSLAREYELCIIVQTENGAVLASTESMHNCVIHNISYRDRARLYLDAKSNGGSLLERFTFDPQDGSFHSVKDKETTSEENIILTKCVPGKNNTDIVIFINSVLTPVNATVKTLNRMLIFISIALLIIALIISFIISSRLTKPLKKLTNSAKELAVGNYDADFSERSSKEVSILADSLAFASNELKKNEALRRELIANISHDLRTPLTLITGYAEVMKDIPNEMTADNLQIIIDESKRLSSLVNDVLDVSKLQANTIELKKERFDITEVIKETAVRYQKLVDQDGYNICFMPTAPCTVFADRQKILQVLYNLVNNAVTHTGNDKTVVIRQGFAEHNGRNYVRIEVTDTGDGIAPDKLPLVWDRYYKIDKFHRRAQMGSGLGLSIVKSLIELHEGYYGVYSTVGHGSTFWFELPIAE